MFEPSLILHSGQIYTVDEIQPWAEAVAIRKHRIIAVGDSQTILALAGPKTEVIDLAGRLVLPGLCDAHIHMYDWSLGLRRVPLEQCTSRAETTFPTAQEIDRVTKPNQPAIFWRSDMHCAVVNSAALQRAGITAATEHPNGGVIDHDGAGQPTGILKEFSAMDLVAAHMPRWEGAALDEVLQEGFAKLHSLGITAVHDQRVKERDEGPRMLASYQRLRRADALQVRVNCNIAAHDLPHLQGLGLQSGLGDDYLRLGHVKVFADGSLGSRTAWMLEPFVS